MIKPGGFAACFNREYMPLGETDHYKSIGDRNYNWVAYSGLTDMAIKRLSFYDDLPELLPENLSIWFYSDKTNPIYTLDFSDYFERLKILSTLKRKCDANGYFVDEIYMSLLRDSKP